jgi:hypothetical protein
MCVALSLTVQESVHDGNHTIPLGLLGSQLTPAGRRELVAARPPVIRRHSPLATNEAALFEPHQPRIEGSHIDLQGAARDLLQSCGDRVAVQWPERSYGLKDHEVERALQDVGLCVCSIGHQNGLYTSLLGSQMEKTGRLVFAGAERVLGALWGPLDSVVRGQSPASTAAGDPKLRELEPDSRMAQALDAIRRVA